VIFNLYTITVKPVCPTTRFASYRISQYYFAMSFIKILSLQTKDLRLLSTYAQPVIPMKNELCPPLALDRQSSSQLHMCVLPLKEVVRE
jgi:hypothetical protein